MASDDEKALITRLRYAFAENIKSRPEAARIRSDVAAKVNSYVIYDAHSEVIPTRVESPRKEITGIRRKYLEALKVNVEARGRYQRASTGRNHPQSPQSCQLLPRTDVVLSNLQFSRLEKDHRELDIRLRYAQSLSLDTWPLCNLDISRLEERNGVDSEREHHDEISTDVAEVEALTSKLQKAVLQANHQLERQKALVARLKQTQARADPGSTGSDGRASAIATTRGVLVAWLDEKLSESGVYQADDLNRLHRESHDEREQLSSSITENYLTFVTARKTAVEAANEALQPLPVPPQLCPAENEETAPKEQSPASDDLSLVHSISQRLVPLLQKRSHSTTLKAFSSAQTAKARKDTVGALERLADESSLLSTYPFGSFESNDKLTRNVAAWQSAARAASTSAANTIEQNDKEGLQALSNGDEELADLRSRMSNHVTHSKQDDGVNWKGIHGKLESSKIF